MKWIFFLDPNQDIYQYIFRRLLYMTACAWPLITKNLIRCDFYHHSMRHYFPCFDFWFFGEKIQKNGTIRKEATKEENQSWQY